MSSWNYARGWWTGRCGIADVMKLALPLIVSMASVNIMQFFDRMFLTWHSTEEMAASFPAGVLSFVIICFPLGITGYVNSFVAQYHGAERPEKIGPVLGQAIWFGWICTPIFMLFWPLSPYLFSLLGQSGGLAILEDEYFRISLLGAGAVVISGAQSAFFTGRGDTKTVMLVDLGVGLLDLLLNYLWIFGYGGFPEMGLAGAALSTSLCQWLKVLVLWLLIGTKKNRRIYHLAEGHRWNFHLTLRLLQFGAPSGFQMLVDVSAFNLFIFLIGQLGPVEMGATTLAFSMNTLAFMPIYGMSIAVSTIVGQQLGENRPDLAARGTWAGLMVAELYMGLFAMLYLFVPQIFLLGHEVGSDPAQFEPVRNMAFVLLRFVAAYTLFDAMLMIFAGALKGAGDMRFVMLSAICMAPVPTLIGWSGVHFFGWGIYWCWTAMTAWIIGYAMLYFIRFLGGKWRSMRVIEPDQVDILEPPPPGEIAEDGSEEAEMANERG